MIHRTFKKKRKGGALWTSLPGAVVTIAKPRKPVRQRSRKLTIAMRMYVPLMLDYLKRNPKCQRCGKSSQCLHHWAGRRGNLLKTETWRAACGPCNQFAKEHPAEARAENWIAPVGVYKV